MDVPIASRNNNNNNDCCMADEWCGSSITRDITTFANCTSSCWWVSLVALCIYIHARAVFFIISIYSLMVGWSACVCLLVLFGVRARTKAAHPVPILSESRSSTGTTYIYIHTRVYIHARVFCSPYSQSHTWKTCANFIYKWDRHGLVRCGEEMIIYFIYFFETLAMFFYVEGSFSIHINILCAMKSARKILLTSYTILSLYLITSEYNTVSCVHLEKLSLPFCEPQSSLTFSLCIVNARFGH